MFLLKQLSSMSKDYWDSATLILIKILTLIGRLCMCGNRDEVVKSFQFSFAVSFQEKAVVHHQLVQVRAPQEVGDENQHLGGRRVFRHSGGWAACQPISCPSPLPAAHEPSGQDQSQSQPHQKTRASEVTRRGRYACQGRKRRNQVNCACNNFTRVSL